MMDKMQNAKTMEKKNVGNDKLRLLAVLKIMQRTDEDHPLTKNQIMNKVVEQGIEVSNIKTIAADLATLKDAGYDIVTNYSGSFMTDGQIFQNYELKILADNIANARYLPLEESEFIIERLREMATESGDEMIAATTIMDPKMKSKDITMKYKLDTLFRCIQKKKKVKFWYKKPGGERKVHYEYEVSPYALSLYEEEYYLTAAFAAGHSYSKIPFSFKVSRMERVEETGEPARKMTESCSEARHEQYGYHRRDAAAPESIAFFARAYPGPDLFILCISCVIIFHHIHYTALDKQGQMLYY